MATENLGDALNVDASASDLEVQELDKVLNPEQPKQDLVDEEHDDGDLLDGDPSGEEERTGRVDQELEDAPDEAAREVIRAKRRLERQNKKQRARDKIQTLERRLADEKQQRINVEARLQNLERTNLSGQMAQLNQAEVQAEQTESQLTAAIAEASAKNDGATVAEATRRLVQLQSFKTQITAAKTNLEQQASKPPQRHLDPNMVAHADAFRKRNSWYKGTNATDEHSRIVSAVDATMFNEGWDPSTEAYWEELEARASKYIPERFNKGGAPTNRGSYNSGDGKGSGAGTRRSPVAGAGGSSGSSQPGGVRTFQLSEARVRAMKDSGAWDDPVRKAKLIKDYAAYDKEHPKS